MSLAVVYLRCILNPAQVSYAAYLVFSGLHFFRRINPLCLMLHALPVGHFQAGPCLPFPIYNFIYTETSLPCGQKNLHGFDPTYEHRWIVSTFSMISLGLSTSYTTRSPTSSLRGITSKRSAPSSRRGNSCEPLLLLLLLRLDVRVVSAANQMGNTARCRLPRKLNDMIAVGCIVTCRYYILSNQSRHIASNKFNTHLELCTQIVKAG